MSEILKKLMDEIPLETKIKVSNEMAFINLIVELGYREDKMWTDDEDKLLNKLCKLAEKHTKSILEDIKEENKKLIFKLKELELYKNATSNDPGEEYKDWQYDKDTDEIVKIVEKFTK